MRGSVIGAGSAAEAVMSGVSVPPTSTVPNTAALMRSPSVPPPAGTDLVQFIQCRKQQNAERRQRTENTQRILHGDAPRAARLRRLCRRAVARGERGRQPAFFRQDAV